MNNETLLAVIQALACNEPQAKTTSKRMIGEDVIVRCRDAGVHFGELVAYEGREVVLKNARRMWYWKAKSGHTLSGCADAGITDESKITAAVDEIVLTEACEIISCTDEAARSLRNAPVYQPG